MLSGRIVRALLGIWLLGCAAPAQAAQAAQDAPAAPARIAAASSLRAQQRELDAAEALLRKRLEALLAGGLVLLQREPDELILRIPVRELFEPDSDQFKEHAMDSSPWSAVTALLRKRHRLVAQINVYSDSIGGEIANHGLSELRALSLLTAMHSASIASTRVTGSGVGAAVQLAGEDTPEGRDQNRRVEVVFGLAHPGPAHPGPGSGRSGQ
ncbi:MAG TPA: OmpA family protein [Steroidobacteraceae bacterium]|nr:OmpA family protein [Steroidobacteraceae bacterium]